LTHMVKLMTWASMGSFVTFFGFFILLSRVNPSPACCCHYPGGPDGCTVDPSPSVGAFEGLPVGDELLVAARSMKIGRRSSPRTAGALHCPRVHTARSTNLSTHPLHCAEFHATKCIGFIRV
jgi:hypothetical protein